MAEIFTQIRAYILIIITFFSVIFFGTTPDRATKDVITEEDSVRIMSFNVRYGEYEQRFNLVPQLIGEYMPDSVGVQECTYQWYLTLKTFLPEYEFIGVGRDTGNRLPNCGEMSAVLYRKDKYKLIDSGTFWLSETPEKVSFGWDADCRRICTWVILENKETGEQYAHVNTHLDHVGKEARIYGSEMVRDFALSFDMPMVLTGDFNLNKGSELYNGIIATGLVDTQDVAENTMYGKTYHGYNGGEEGTPIDFIFINDKITSVETYKIVRDMFGEQHSSDHYPVYADIKF